MGATGPTTFGPTGPAGPSGATGAQGATGYTGATGNAQMAGISGAQGFTGAAGSQGAMGQTGAQGPLAANGSWSPYRDYTFNSSSDAIGSADSGKAREIANYMGQNPSYRLGIDGYNANRVDNVRDALVNAGVPAFKIQTGPFGDPQLRRDSRVAVLLTSK
jgi:hypothetical protein